MMRDDPDAEPAIGVADGIVGLDLFFGERVERRPAARGQDKPL
jgi:hypothetical protein